MRPQGTQTLKGTYTVTNMSTGVTTTQQRSTYGDTLSYSPIVHGNFTSPNSWNTEGSRTSYLKGTCTWLDGSKLLPYIVASGAFGVEGSTNVSGPGSSDITKYRNLVYNKALDRLNEKTRGSLDLSVGLAESGQTIRMLRAVTGLRRYIGGIGSKRWANEWLQLKYGWLPLLSDIYGAADESLRYCINTIEKFSASASLKQDIGRTYPVFADGMACGSHRSSGYANYRHKFGISLYIPDPEFDLTRWTSLNPISIGWELLPYSFVVDWVFDVGGYLRSMETALLYADRFRGGYSTSSYIIEENLSAKGINRESSTNVKVFELSCSFRRTFMDRQVLGSYPVPRLPTFHAELGSSRLLSAAALLRQLLR